METVRVRDAADLGAVVRATRVAAGLSQGELAAEASVGRQWLVAFEAGDKHSAPFDMVLRLLRVLQLGVTIDPTVARRSASPVVDPPSASKILARYTTQA